MSQYVKVTSEDELTHWGVLGMKWGVRKDRDGVSYRKAEKDLDSSKLKSKDSRGETRKTRRIGPLGTVAAKGVAGAHKTIGKVQRSSANAAKKDEKSIRTQRKQMLALTKNGKPLFNANEVDDIANYYAERASILNKKADKHEKFANQILSDLAEVKVRDLNKKK